MIWSKININYILNLLRDMEKNDIMIGGEYAVVYSDLEEELKISYNKLK